MGAEDVEAGVEEGCMVDGGDEAAEVITTPSQINILHHHHRSLSIGHTFLPHPKHPSLLISHTLALGRHYGPQTLILPFRR
jgi:hypothetical protein